MTDESFLSATILNTIFCLLTSQILLQLYSFCCSLYLHLATFLYFVGDSNKHLSLKFKGSRLFEVGRLFEGGRLLNNFTSRMGAYSKVGAYSRVALIQSITIS